MPSTLEAAGAARAASPAAALHTGRFITGMWTQRSPLRDAATPFLYEKFYGATRFDSLLDGLNCEISSRLTLKRRGGLSVYNAQTFAKITRFYEFRSFNQDNESIQVIADTAESVYDATGPNTKTTILLKGSGAADAHFLGAGNVLYIGDGAEQKAYQKSPATTRNWGIAIGSVGSAVGPTYPTVAADVAYSFYPWSNPNNILLNDGSFADAVIPNIYPAVDTTDYLQAKTFGFAIPASSTIVGILVEVGGLSLAGANSTMTVQLLKNGAYVGASKGSGWPVSNQFTAFGGTSDLWNETWTPGDINNANFGVSVLGSSSNDHFYVDSVRITIYSLGGPMVTPVAGSLSPTKGYSYVFAYGNNQIPSGENISNPTPPSAGTGAQTNKDFHVDLTASTDPQVNKIHVYRTDDGGSAFLELPTSPYPNTTATITDSATDDKLNPNAAFPFAPYSLNSPPPGGAVDPVYHNSRTWVHVGNTVYYSNGPAASLGNNLEQFPPLQFFIFPSLVVKKLVCAVGLLVFTTSDIWLIAGNGIAGVSPYFAVRLQAEFGLAGFDAICMHGTEVWLMATDGRVLRFDTNSIASANGTFFLAQDAIAEPGFPIGDLLGAGTFTADAVQLTYHRGGSADTALFVSDKLTGWYRGSYLAPPEQQGFIWSPLALVTGGCSAVQSVQTARQTHLLLVGPVSSGPILQRDLTVNRDNGSAFVWNAIIGSIVLAQTGHRAEVDRIVSFARGGTPQVYVLLNEIAAINGAAFRQLLKSGNEPALGPASVSVFNDRFDLLQTQDSTWCEHLQIKLAYTAQDVAEELLSYSIYGELIAE